jgi:hypothetical protein
MKSKIISGIIAALYIGVGFLMGEESVLHIAGFLLLPMACIWCSDGMGSYTGSYHSWRITEESPEGLIAFCGWLLLLLPLLLVLLIGKLGAYIEIF